ncbi:MAG TPA: redox-active disulfide protein 2 [Firmicutes bacterium]|jgi:small redox-active disulfide protein 2|nr:redox-active disulfide protein 2 [Bacillota bacterium]
MTIKVLGSGCNNCKKLLENVQAAVAELKLDATIEYVTDFAKIAASGLMRTPGLIVDNKIVSAGRVLSKSEVIDLLK